MRTRAIAEVVSNEVREGSLSCNNAIAILYRGCFGIRGNRTSPGFKFKRALLGKQ